MNPEKEAKGVIRSGLAVIAVGAAAFLLWGFWAPLSGAIIAHRPSLLRNVDKMLVLNDGAVASFGPRAEVMARVTRQAA